MHHINTRDGPEQYENEDGTLMMLPTDLALKNDPIFSKIALEYAESESKFFQDFRLAFGKLMCLGCPSDAIPAEISASSNCRHCPSATTTSGGSEASLKFREHVMHGSFERAKQVCRESERSEEEEGGG
jgi:catalase (peroxidase I)